jgi:cation:H+ antiporter
MINDILRIAASLVFLFFGAEGLVSGSTTLTLRPGLTPLVIGLTVVV